MLKIGICDDSKIFLICAEKLIRKWSDERRIPVKIYTFNNGDKLVAANTEERLDIIFLDIIMPLLNGMDAARERREEREKEREKEQARRRMEKKVSGVALDTKLPSPDKKKVKSDDINEITLSDIEDMPVVQEENKVVLTATNGSQEMEQGTSR